MSEASQKPALSVRKVGLYALAAVIVICVALFLIGRYQLQQAGRIRREAKVKLTQATVYIASQASLSALAAQRRVSERNWGSAREDIARVVRGVLVMEQIAPREMEAQVSDVKRNATKAQEAVGASSDESLQSITDLLQSLQAVREQPLAD